MRVLQVTHGFPPMSRWGVQLYTYGLSRELSRRHEVHVLYPNRDPHVERYSVSKHDADGMHIIEIASWDPVFPTLMNPRLVYKNRRIDERFEALIDQVNPDIVHFQHLIGLSSSLIEIAKKQNVRAVLTLHDFWFVCPLVQLLKDDDSICSGADEQGQSCCKCWNNRVAQSPGEFVRWNMIGKALSGAARGILMAANRPGQFRDRNDYMKSLLLRVDKMIAPSNFLREVYLGCGIPEERIVHLSNGYDLSAFEGFQKKENRNVVFGFAGAVTKHKGAHLLVEAFNLLDSDNAQLKIYGDYDSQSKYFRELQASVKNDNIRFMGRFEDVRVPYSHIDVLVFPSTWYENCPLVLQEAMITGTPVIASNVGAIPEYVVHGESGLLFEVGNSRDLAEKMRTIVDTPDLVSRFAANTQPVKSMSDHAREIERVYQDVLD